MSAVVLDLFFFSSRRRHTRWTGDWSSDVCSSDLLDVGPVVGFQRIGRTAANGFVKPAGTIIISPVWPRHGVAVVQRIHVHRKRKLLVVVDACGAAGLFFCASQRRQQQPRKNSDDGDDHQKLDERERGATLRAPERETTPD